MMRRKYTPQDRSEAIKLADEIGQKAAADRLGINESTMYNWMTKSKRGQNGYSKDVEIIDLADENRRLRKELQESQQEVEILQSALVFLQSARRNKQNLTV